MSRNEQLQAPPAMTEGELEALVEQAFRLGGWLVFHTRDSRRSEPGFPDIVAVKAPWVVFSELKASGEKVKAGPGPLGAAGASSPRKRTGSRACVAVPAWKPSSGGPRIGRSSSRWRTVVLGPLDRDIKGQ